MQIEHLSLFLSAAKSGSITKAAQEYYITPQGASSALKTLEKQLGVKLFRKQGSSLKLTEKGAVIAEAAENVLSAYRKLQGIAAMRESESQSEDVLRVVTTPFGRQTFASTIQEYAENLPGSPWPTFKEKSTFDIIRTWDSLKDDTLYIVDLPLDLDEIADEVPREFRSAVLQPENIFRPFALSSFLIKCSERNPLASKRSVNWDEIHADEVACHDDPFLQRIISNHITGCQNNLFGMKVSNTELINSAINQAGMVGISASLPVVFGERNWKKPVRAKAIEPRPRLRFVTGTLGRKSNLHAESYHHFMKRLLMQAIPSYMTDNDPSIFFAQRPPCA